MPLALQPELFFTVKDEYGLFLSGWFNITKEKNISVAPCAAFSSCISWCISGFLYIVLHFTWSVHVSLCCFHCLSLYVGLLNYELALCFVFGESPHSSHHRCTSYPLTSNGWGPIFSISHSACYIWCFLIVITLVKVRSYDLEFDLYYPGDFFFNNEPLSLYSWSFDRLLRNTW